MTVKELIKKLSEYKDDLVVKIQNGDDGGCYTGSRVVSTLYFEDGCIILDD